MPALPKKRRAMLCEYPGASLHAPLLPGSLLNNQPEKFVFSVSSAGDILDGWGKCSVDIGYSCLSVKM
jgi:hypothetical protein